VTELVKCSDRMLHWRNGCAAFPVFRARRWQMDRRPQRWLAYNAQPFSMLHRRPKWHRMGQP